MQTPTHGHSTRIHDPPDLTAARDQNPPPVQCACLHDRRVSSHTQQLRTVITMTIPHHPTHPPPPRALLIQPRAPGAWTRAAAICQPGMIATASTGRSFRRRRSVVRLIQLTLLLAPPLHPSAVPMPSPCPSAVTACHCTRKRSSMCPRMHGARNMQRSSHATGAGGTYELLAPEQPVGQELPGADGAGGVTHDADVERLVSRAAISLFLASCTA